MENFSNIKLERIGARAEKEFGLHKSNLNSKIISSISGMAFARKLNFNSKIMKKFNWLITFMICTCIAYMFELKSHVQDLNFELRQISSQINQENKQYSLLKAELAYLKSPERLRALASKYLIDLDNVKPQQIVIENKKNGHLNRVKFAELANKKTSTRWRFKKGSSNIVTTSGKKVSR